MSLPCVLPIVDSSAASHLSGSVAGSTAAAESEFSTEMEVDDVAAPKTPGEPALSYVLSGQPGVSHCFFCRRFRRFSCLRSRCNRSQPGALIMMVARESCCLAVLCVARVDAWWLAVLRALFTTCSLCAPRCCPRSDSRGLGLSSLGCVVNNGFII